MDLSSADTRVWTGRERPDRAIVTVVAYPAEMDYLSTVNKWR
jgi:hypothetical protein